MEKHAHKHIHHSGLLTPFLSGNQAKKRGKFISVIGEIHVSKYSLTNCL